MSAMTAYVTIAAVVLAIGALLTWWQFGPNRIAWFTGGRAQLNTFALVCAGFALGMLAMYIAMHVYRS